MSNLGGRELSQITDPLDVHDVSQAYEFTTVAAYTAFNKEFPVGKIIRLLDRGAEFQVIAGTGTANTFNIIASAQVSQSITYIVKSHVSVDAMGAVGDGVANDNEAISRALDLALSTDVKKVIFPSEVYFTQTVIFLPLTLLSEGVLVIDGTGARLIGPVGDTINIWETAKTTVSWLGITNWAEPPESSIHSNTHIINFHYENYDIALRLYNFNFNCNVSGSTWRRGKTGMHAKRCFYMSFTQNNMRPGYVGKPDAEPTILFEAFSNTIFFNDNHISNFDNTQGTGIGIKCIAGANAFNLSDCTIEGCDIGLWLGGECRPFDIISNYFEANNISIFHNDGALSGTISNNWFADPVTYETVSGVADQLLWDKNHIVNGGTITENSSTSSLQIRDTPQFANSGDYTAGVARPADQVLGNASKFLNEGFQIAYNPVGGFAGAGGRSLIPYGDMLMPFNYFGRLFRIDTPIPFVDISYSNPTLTLDTQIQFLANYSGGIIYDLTIFHSGGTDYLAGRTLGDASIVQFDAVGRTVTMVNNGGLMRFTITGFGTGSTPTIFGRIRAT